MSDLGLMNGILISLGVITLIFFTGLSFLYILKSEKSGLYRVCCSLVVGIFIHAGVGILILNFANKQAAALAGISVLFLIDLSALIHSLIKKRPFLFLEWNRGSLFSLATWIAFIILCNALVYSHIDFPDHLPEGAYIVKRHSMPVKIQVVTLDLPADNLIPYLTSEYFLREIDFRVERPLLPGQEVTNRTLLMSLVAMPFRAALFKPEKFEGSLGTYSYVGSEWPDFQKLVDNQLYSVYVSIGLALNSLIFFAFMLLYKELVGTKFLKFASLIYILTPYVMIQTIFIWPKNLAAFFILLALYRVIKGEKGIAFTFFLLGLAYHSHPFALVFIGGFFTYYLIQDWKARQLKSSIKAIAVTVLMLAPWMIWGKLILGIKSDLIMQNLIPDSIKDFFWVRIYHLYMVWSPSFFEIYPFNPDVIFRRMMVCIPGVVGMLTFGFSYYSLCKLIKSDHREWVLACLILPLTLILLIFSRPNTPIFHGYQVFVPILIILAFRFFKNFNRKFTILLFSIQCLLGLLLLGNFLNGKNISLNQNEVSQFQLFHHGNINIIKKTLPVNVDIPIQFSESTQRCIWMNPVAIVRFDDLLISQRDAFEATLTFHPEVVGLSGHDGAQFKVELLENDKILETYEYFHKADGTMNRIHIDLSKYSGKTIGIQLSNYPGPAKNVDGDWCLWINPIIRREK